MSTRDVIFSCILGIELPHNFSFEAFGDYESVAKPVAYRAESKPIGSLPLRSLYILSQSVLPAPQYPT